MRKKYLDRGRAIDFLYELDRFLDANKDNASLHIVMTAPIRYVGKRNYAIITDFTNREFPNISKAITRHSINNRDPESTETITPASANLVMRRAFRLPFCSIDGLTTYDAIINYAQSCGFEEINKPAGYIRLESAYIPEEYVLPKRIDSKE